MLNTALTSELEAVNTLLAAVGETSVNSLDSTGLADVSEAMATLGKVSREVQMIGWHFNTEEEYPLPLDVNGRIFLPQNTLKISQQSTAKDITQRGLKLYNKTDHTDVFTETLKVTIVFLLAWDDLPQVARHYIMVRASRIFQAHMLGSDSQFQFSQEEEASAKKHLIEAEGETGNFNIFNGSSVASIMQR